MSRFQKIISLGLLSAAFSIPNVVCAADITAALEQTAVSQVGSIYKSQATDQFSVGSISSNTSSTYYDYAKIGTPVLSNKSYLYVDSSGVVNATIGSGTAWETYQSSALPSSSTATFTHSVTQTLSNGASTTTKILKLIFTAGTGAVALTNTAAAASLNSISTPSLGSSNAGTALTCGTALPTGWTLKGWLDNGSGTAVSASLEALGFTWTQPLVTSGGTSVSFAASISGVYGSSWNVSTSSAATQKLQLVSSGGDVLEWTFALKNLSRTMGIASSLVNAFATPPSTHVNQTSQALMNPLSTGVTEDRALITASPTLDIHSLFNAMAYTAISAATTTTADFQGGLGTDLLTHTYGAVALTPSDVAISGWAALGTDVNVTGTVGSGKAKVFTCDLSGITTAKWNTTTNPVLKFQAPDKHAFFMKTFIAAAGTGELDGTIGGTVSGAPAKSILAALIVNAMSGTVTTVAHAPLDAIEVASQS